MVVDDAGGLTLPGGIGSVVDVLFLAATEPDEADDVVRTWVHRVVAEGDAGVGGCLSADGGVGSDGDVGGEGDDAAHVEDDDFLRGTGNGGAERPRAAIVQIGHMDDFAATTALNITAMTFGTGEGGHLVLGYHRQ